MISELVFRIRQRINRILLAHRYKRALKNAPDNPWGLCWIDKKRKYRTLEKAIDNAKPNEFIFILPSKKQLKEYNLHP